jgi:hypothetical protein
VELMEVVGGGDQAPLGPDGGSAASVEAVDPAVVLGVGEDRVRRAVRDVGRAC